MWRALVSTTVLLMCPSLFVSHRSSWTFHNDRIRGWSYKNPFSYQARRPEIKHIPYQLSSYYSKLWTSTGVVPDILSEVPSQNLQMEFIFGAPVRLNATVDTGLMINRPRLTWSAEPGSLYTVVLVDNGIERLEGKQYIHWMVTNIPGTDVDRGVEVMEYVPVFKFTLTEAGSLDKSPYNNNKILALVYKQWGKIVVDETQRGCTPDIITGRIGDKDEIAKKNNLQLVAGSFFNSRYSGPSTDQLLCRFSKCTREPFPVLLPGVNSGAECQPKKDVQDITVRAPKPEKKKDYFKYSSLLNPISITNAIKNTEVSTGVLRDFQVTEGIFNGVTNSELTPGGLVTFTFLMYKNKELAQGLFRGEYPGVIEAAGPLLGTMINSSFIEVTVSEPDDQDWDVDIVLRDPEAVMDVNIVRVIQGQEENFQKLRNRMRAKAQNSKYVVSTTKFKVDRETNDVDSNALDILSFETTRKEVSITVYKSTKDRDLAQNEYLRSALAQEYRSTYNCVACVTLTSRLDLDYYPPFP